MSIVRDIPKGTNVAEPVRATHISALTRAAPQTRLEAGRALRAKVPRKGHAVWKLPPNRPDPVQLLMDSDKGRIAKLLPIRYGRMSKSPFAFLRGAAAIMAFDLAQTPTTRLRVQACGDCHIMNFGGFQAERPRESSPRSGPILPGAYGRIRDDARPRGMV
jgi:hypothetical protein